MSDELSVICAGCRIALPIDAVLDNDHCLDCQKEANR